MRKYRISANQKPLMCIALAQTRSFGVWVENKKKVHVVEMIFFLFSNMTRRMHRRKKNTT